MNEPSTTIRFYDHGENQEGLVVVRRFGDKVSICLSLEENGDVEALVERQVVEKLSRRRAARRWAGRKYSASQ